MGQTPAGSPGSMGKRTDPHRQEQSDRQADSRNQSDKPHDRTAEDRAFDERQGAGGAPNAGAHERGSRADAPGADAVAPGRPEGAAGQTVDGGDPAQNDPGQDGGLR